MKKLLIPFILLLMSLHGNAQISNISGRNPKSVYLQSLAAGDSILVKDGNGYLGWLHKTDLGISGSGEANTASNLGGGLANWNDKNGVDLRFNTFAAADFDLASNLIT